jgi:hypothetical protein
MEWEEAMSKPMRLSEMPKTRRGRRSAIDELPDSIVEQLIEARSLGTHSVPEMVSWLHDPTFDEQYLHITISMLDTWFGRRGHRAKPQ